MDRRDALKKLAAAGATAVGAPTVLSSAAFADSGTQRCQHSYTAPASLSASLTRPQNNRGRAQVTVSTAGLSGSCGCGGTASLSYAFWVRLSDSSTVIQSSSGWQTSNTFDTGSLVIGGGNSAFSYEVQVGIRLSCPGATAARPDAVICRFATVTGTNAPTTVAGVPLAASSATNLPGC